ncbi:MAG: GTP-binding protein [Candidatus ainarchaeum sp.]|nr:GTP-binding protein [Candidatus ainarchaeum sp.]
MGNDREFLGFVITGHMDHGKSTLIGRLLFDTGSLPEGKIEEVRKTCELLGRKLEFAYVVDHLREEREGGMTIDTAQTFFRHGGRDYAIIDAPGHKEFMKNMVTGASQADAAVLIIDASEGLKEQTRRHAYVLAMLGLRDAVVVINKMDLVGYSEGAFEKLKGEAVAFLSRLGMAPPHVIPISAMSGENVVKRAESMPWHRGLTLIESLAGMKPRESLKAKALRLPVQDVYGFGGKRVAVGRVESGTLAPGMEAGVLPWGGKVRVGALEGFGSRPERAECGMNAGFADAAGLKRGDVVFAGSPPFSGRTIRGSVFWLGAKPLAKGELVVCRIATQEVVAKVEAIRNRMDSSTLEVIEEDAERLEGTEAAEVTLSASAPLAYDLFSGIPTMGRFVLVRDGLVEGGGIIARAVK